MAGKSKIEWCSDTWNPIVGCSVVSPGCTNCYAMTMAARIEKMASSPMAQYVNVQTHYAGTTQQSKAGAVWTGKIAQAPDHILTAPLRWKKPRRIFVNSMGDLFHESIPDEWIDKVFAVMALCPQHTFQVLTKRAERMRDYFNIGYSKMGTPRRCMNVEDVMMRFEAGKIGPQIAVESWPLPNVWLGVSCERQQEADERIPHLMATPAAVRFISAEPLLGPLTITYLEWVRLDWVIVGGESGKNARPMHPDWARSIRDQCAAAGVAFFFKQWGEWFPWLNFNDNPNVVDDNPEQSRFDARIWCEEGVRWDEHSGCWDDDPGAAGPDESDQIMGRVGKKAAGRLLDGKEHNAFPVIEGSASQPGLSSPDSKSEQEATA